MESSGNGGKTNFNMSLISCFVFIILSFSFCNAATNCPLMGPTFPKPQHLSQSVILQDAVKNLTALFNQIDGDNSTGTYDNSYSIQIFSASDSTPIFQHSHTAQNLTNQNTTGVTKVDANTVFRIGSPTKIFSVYAFLIEAGDAYFNDPITKFVPELAALAANQTGNALTKVAWEDITIGELASHMAGISNDSKSSNSRSGHELTCSRYHHWRAHSDNEAK